MRKARSRRDSSSDTFPEHPSPQARQASITHNPPHPHAIARKSHLGSLQHFPFVQDLHGKHFVGVSHFHHGNLRGGERQGSGERVGGGSKRMPSMSKTDGKQSGNLSLKQEECKMMSSVQRYLTEKEQHAI